MYTSNSLDFDMFYKLSDPLANRPLRLRLIVESNRLSVDEMFALGQGHLQLKVPLKFEASMGRQATDFLWTETPPLVCVSSRCIDLLVANQCTGWSTYPVEVYNRKGNLLPDYYGFAMTDLECRRDRSRSEIIEKPPPAPRGQSYKVYKGLYFYEDCWDGSDFFWVRPFGGRIITKKVYQLFKKAKVRNIRTVPLPEVELDVSLDKYEK